MGFVTVIVMAAFGAGGGMIFRFVAIRLGLDHTLPAFLPPAVGAYVWGIAARKLWANLQKALAESQAAGS